MTEQTQKQNKYSYYNDKTERTLMVYWYLLKMETAPSEINNYSSIEENNKDITNKIFKARVEDLVEL